MITFNLVLLTFNRTRNHLKVLFDLPVGPGKFLSWWAGGGGGWVVDGRGRSQVAEADLRLICNLELPPLIRSSRVLQVLLASGFSWRRLELGSPLGQ